MKFKLVTAIIVAALIIGGGIVEEIYVAKTFTELSDRLEKFIQEEDETYDINGIKETYDWWNRKHKYLELTLPHVQLNEIEITFGELIGAVEAEDFDSAQALLNRIKLTSDALQDTFGFRIGNII